MAYKELSEQLKDKRRLYKLNPSVKLFNEIHKLNFTMIEINKGIGVMSDGGNGNYISAIKAR